MNDHSGRIPGQGTVLPFDSGHSLPANTGLRDVAIVAPTVQSQRFSLAEAWRVLAKWWWLIVAITVACLLAAVVISLLIKPEYRARATMEINREGNQAVQIGEVAPVQMQDREYLSTQAGLLRSRSLAERVARSLNLANNPQYGGEGGDRSARESRAASVLQGQVAVNPVRETRLIEVAVESTDPVAAARVANAYAENFIQQSLERRFEATSYARTFLEQRLATVRARLEASERQLVAYAQRQGIVNVQTGSGSSQTEQPIDAATLVSLNEALSEARSERIAAEQRYRQTQGARAATETVNNSTVQSLTSQRAELQAEYQEKLGIFQPDYPQMVQLRSRIQSLDRAIQQEGRNVTSASSGLLRSEYVAAVGRENALQARVNQLKASLLNLRGRSIQYTILQREVDTNRSLYDALLQRYREVGVAGGVGANMISVIDRAEVPGAPFKPNLPLNIAIGLLAGLLLGFGAAFALEWMDDTIKTPEDLRNKLGITPLGLVPAAAKGTIVHEHLGDARSPISEAYQSIRTALEFSTDHGVPKTLLVTSTRAAEGKSSSSLAIARTLAKLGQSVLLVDADLRKPTFRGPSVDAAGLSTLLAGGTDVRECIHATEQEDLFLLPSGQIPPNPAELLSSERLGSVISEVAGMFDRVIIDGPPVLGLADAPLLASRCEGTLMVIEAGAIRRTAVVSAIGRLQATGARIVGGVLTKFSATKSGYGYGYGYGYGEEAYAYREGEKPKKQIELLQST